MNSARSLIASHAAVDLLVRDVPAAERRRVLSLLGRAVFVRLANEIGDEDASAKAYAIADEIATRRRP